MLAVLALDWNDHDSNLFLLCTHQDSPGPSLLPLSLDRTDLEFRRQNLDIYDDDVADDDDDEPAGEFCRNHFDCSNLLLFMFSVVLLVFSALCLAGYTGATTPPTNATPTPAIRPPASHFNHPPALVALTAEPFSSGPHGYSSIHVPKRAATQSASTGVLVRNAVPHSLYTLPTLANNRARRRRPISHPAFVSTLARSHMITTATAATPTPSTTPVPTTAASGPTWSTTVWLREHDLFALVSLFLAIIAMVRSSVSGGLGSSECGVSPGHFVFGVCLSLCVCLCIRT